MKTKFLNVERAHMKRIFLLIFLLSANNAFADQNSAVLSVFVKKYVQAVNKNDLEGLKMLMHPESLKCINSENEDYYTNLFKEILKHDIPGDYEVKIEKIFDDSADSQNELLIASKAIFPKFPEYMMRIDYFKTQYLGATIIRSLVKEEDGFYDVFSCPSPEKIINARKNRKKEDVALIRAEELYNALDDTLKGQMIELLKNASKAEALKLYRTKTGESLFTAINVLSHIEINMK